LPSSLRKQAELAGRNGERHAAVGAGVEARFETWKADLKFLQGSRAAAGKSRLFPDFIEAARIAGVAPLQVDRPDAEPACDPDVDGIGLRQRTAGYGRGISCTLIA
jgi:hypothetical protein